MTLVEKMLTGNGITPKSQSTDNGNNSNQEGAEGAGGGNGGENNNGDSSANSSAENNGNNNSGAGEAGAGSAAGENNNGEGAGAGANAPQPLSDEAVLKELELRGIKVASIADLKPAEQEQQISDDEKLRLEAERKNKIRSHALTNGKVTTTKLDAYAVESTLPAVELGFAVFKRDKLAELKTANTPDDQIPNDEDLRNEFNEVNFQFADPTDPKRILAEKRLRNEQDLYLQQTYPEIYDMEDEYEEVQEVSNLRTNYNSAVSEVFTGLPQEQSFTIKDGDKDVAYPVKFSTEELAVVKEIFNGEKMFDALGRSKATKDHITEAVTNTLIAKHLPKIISDIANAHASAKIEAMQKGRRNIFNTTTTGADNTEKRVSPGVQKMLNKQKPAAGVNA